MNVASTTDHYSADMQVRKNLNFDLEQHMSRFWFGNDVVAHALTFISECLLNLNQRPLVDAIDDALLKYGIPSQNVRHLLFIFSGNAPVTLLTASLQGYSGLIKQWGVGLHVNEHAAFIAAVYDRVIANANNP